MLGLLLVIVGVPALGAIAGKVSAVLKMSNATILLVAALGFLVLTVGLGWFAGPLSMIEILIVAVVAVIGVLLTITFRNRFQKTSTTSVLVTSGDFLRSSHSAHNYPAVSLATAPTSEGVRDYFVSHASQNATEARIVVERMEAAGLRFLVPPRNIRPGEAYGDAIADAVAHSTKATLVLISEASERSASVKAELELARRFNRPIMPVILKSHEPGKGMIYYIGTSHWLPFDDASPATITALIDA